MKKLLAILLALSMIISLAACGSDSDDDSKSKKDKDEVAEEVVGENNDESNENDDKDEDKNEDSDDVEKPTEGKKPNKNDKPEKDETEDEPQTISRGKIKGDVYTNDCLNLTFTKPSSWRYMSDEELAAAVGASADMFKDPERFEQALESQTSVYDFMVLDPVTGTCLMLCFENLSHAGNANISEEAYISAVEYQLSTQTAMTVERMGDNKVVKLGEEEYLAALYRATVGNQSFVQVYYVRAIGDYMCSVVVTLRGDYDYNDIEAMFS